MLLLPEGRKGEAWEPSKERKKSEILVQTEKFL